MRHILNDYVRSDAPTSSPVGTRASKRAATELSQENLALVCPSRA